MIFYATNFVENTLLSPNDPDHHSANALPGRKAILSARRLAITYRAGWFGMFFGVLWLSGCQTTKPNSATEGMDGAIVTRNQGYALLYSTVDDESQVDKAMFLKKPSAEVVELIKAIAECCKNAVKRLEIYARDDPALDLKNQGLPEIETKTRSAISSATGKQILFSGGKELEFNLLMTQHEALNYIAILAETLAEEECDDVRKHFLAQLSKDAAALRERVDALLKAEHVGPGK